MAIAFKRSKRRINSSKIRLLYKFNSDTFIRSIIQGASLPKGRLDLPEHALQVLHIAGSYARLENDSEIREMYNTYISQLGLPVPIYNNITALPLSGMIFQQNSTLEIVMSTKDKNYIKDLFYNGIVAHCFSETNEYYRGLGHVAQNPGLIQNGAHAPINSFFTQGNFTDDEYIVQNQNENVLTVPQFKISTRTNRYYQNYKTELDYMQTSQDEGTSDTLAIKVFEPINRADDSFLCQPQDTFIASISKSQNMTLSCLLTLIDATQFNDLCTLLCIRMHGTLGLQEILQLMTNYSLDNYRPIRVLDLSENVRNTQKRFDSKQKYDQPSEPQPPMNEGDITEPQSTKPVKQEYSKPSGKGKGKGKSNKSEFGVSFTNESSTPGLNRPTPPKRE